MMMLKPVRRGISMPVKSNFFSSPPMVFICTQVGRKESLLFGSLTRERRSLKLVEDLHSYLLFILLTQLFLV
ncbi:hypothetical protein KSP40_PGU004587 [Platanthera guangdongensis]|uniref:Uncharacterized protein n=1 Tax=Platanthera guangdongensis TaxID=2320717 RepID=A0ABR2N125_9ASPA